MIVPLINVLVGLTFLALGILSLINSISEYKSIKNQNSHSLISFINYDSKKEICFNELFGYENDNTNFIKVLPLHIGSIFSAYDKHQYVVRDFTMKYEDDLIVYEFEIENNKNY